MSKSEKKFLNRLYEAALEDDDSVAEGVMDGVLSTSYDSVMAPVLVRLVRKLHEYEHVLGHVAEDSEWHKPAACADCQRMARVALELPEPEVNPEPTYDPDLPDHWGPLLPIT